MKAIQQNSQYIIPTDSISQSAISKARNDYRIAFIGNADEIKLGVTALRDMFIELGANHSPVQLTVETVQGLLIILDPALRSDGWLVGTSYETIRDSKIMNNPGPQKKGKK